jgi:hypothetical protein
MNSKSNTVNQNDMFAPGIFNDAGSENTKALLPSKALQLAKTISLVVLVLLIGKIAVAQDSTKVDTVKNGWRTGGMIAINLGQGGSRNWAAGAEKWSVSLGTIVNLFADRKMGKWSWDNSLDIGYAFINTQSQGFRKTDDKIYFASKFGRALKPKLDLSILFNFRSQVYDGYDYDYLGQGLKKRTSGFMAPAYVTLAPGLNWKPTPDLSIFLTPISVRWIIVSNKPFDYLFQGGVIPDSVKTPASGDYEKPKAVLYGVDPTRGVRVEAGGFASIAFKKEVVKNVVYTTKLDMFSNYLKSYTFTPPTYTTFTRTEAKPQNVDVYWTNLIAMKVNKYLLVTYSFDLIYDDDVRQFGPNSNVAAAQLRSMLAIGFAAKF